MDPSEALERENFYLRTALEIGKVGFFSYEPRTREFNGSPAMFQIFGVDPSDPLEPAFQKAVFPEDWPRLRELFLQTSLGTGSFSAEYRIHRPDRSVVHLISRAQVVVTPDGPRLLGTIQDISARVQAEELVRLTEDQFRVALENVPVPLMFHAEDGEILALSQPWTDITGFSRAEIATTLDWVTKAYGPRGPEVLDDLNRTYGLSGKVFKGEYPVTCKDGSVRVWEFSAAPVGRLVDGRRAAVSMAQDVTDRKEAEATLRESAYFFKESQRAASIGSFKADFLRDHWESSEVLDSIFGITTHFDRTIPGWLSLVHSEDQAMMARYLEEEVVGKRRPFAKEYRITRRSDGATRWVNGLGAVTFDTQGRLVSMIGTIQDITDKKMTETILQNTQKLEALGLLAGGIAHDFNNLMGGVFGNINLASLKSKDPEVARFLKKALDTIERARGLTQQLLTFSKGGSPVQKDDHLFPFVRDTVEFALSGAQAVSQYDVQEHLWPSSFDRNQIGQVVDNLVINAVQAMPQGGRITIRARNTTLADGDFIKLTVEDTGVGIPPDQIARIFDPFFTTKAQGHGLGLATCHSIVRRHGGMITVESHPGTGTSFHLFLPRAVGTVEDQTAPPVFRFRGSGTALVLDDEEVIRDLLEEMLGDLGFQTVQAASGAEALAFVEAGAKVGTLPDLMVFDLTIPDGLGGKEIIGRVRAAAPGVPVIVASGYADDPVMARPAEYGFTASLRKPFRLSDLEQILSRILS